MAARITKMVLDATGGATPSKGSGLVTRFAERIGTTTSTVSRWRAGGGVDSKWWPALAVEFGVSEDEIADACDGQPTLEGRLSDIVAMLKELTGLVQAQWDDLGGRLPPRAGPGRRARP